MNKEEKSIHEGVITETLPNGMFRVLLDNQDLVLGSISGKIRLSCIRLLKGDKVKMEISRYDSTKGRIIYRIPIKDSEEEEEEEYEEEEERRRGRRGRRGRK